MGFSMIFLIYISMVKKDCISNMLLTNQLPSEIFMNCGSHRCCDFKWGKHGRKDIRFHIGEDK